jgi:hypothetical protein
MKLDGLPEKEAAKQRKMEATRFVVSSVRRFYQRLSKAIEKPVDDVHSPDEGPLSGMCDLVGFLVEEGILQVFEVSQQLKAFYKKVCR